MSGLIVNALTIAITQHDALPNIMSTQLVLRYHWKAMFEVSLLGKNIIFIIYICIGTEQLVLIKQNLNGLRVSLLIFCLYKYNRFLTK